MIRILIILVYSKQTQLLSLSLSSFLCLIISYRDLDADIISIKKKNIQQKINKSVNKLKPNIYGNDHFKY